MRKELGPVDTVIHNAGSGVFKGFLNTTVDELETALGTTSTASSTLHSRRFLI